ncbi:MAG: HAMP domain-containing sensor histidine kinase [Actinomycetota bacterium]|nr:HAMP domain-containing sensor histidine kinase [Actinomycetota bacterium]
MTATFAIGAFALSTLMAGATYLTARQTFLNERRSAAERQAFVNASLVRNALRVPGTQVSQLLTSVDTIPGSRSVLYDRGAWYATSISVGQDAIPRAERSLGLSGVPAIQIFTLDQTPELVVDVPLPAVRAVYFEVLSLAELESTLRTLAITLAGAALVTTVAGALLGRWASGRALRPLAGISEAAVAIAGGQLQTRVDGGDDADLQALAASFNRMAAHLQARIEREARFTSDVSHELRSPLTTLSASVGVIEAHRHRLPEPADRALTLLDGDLRRFRRMVDDLLEISRFDAGSAELSLDEVDPGELVRRSVGSTMPIDDDGRRLEPEFPVVVGNDVHGLRIRVDKRRIERVVANLVDNATAYGNGVARVTVGAAATRRGAGEPVQEPQPGPGRGGQAVAIRIGVEDHGDGIPPDERERLFERFYRGRHSGRRGSGQGTGLGLSLVAEHVRLHGGEVWVEDGPGGGARFVVELPLSPEPPTRREPEGPT